VKRKNPNAQRELSIQLARNQKLIVVKPKIPDSWRKKSYIRAGSTKVRNPPPKDMFPDWETYKKTLHPRELRPIDLRDLEFPINLDTPLEVQTDAGTSDAEDDPLLDTKHPGEETPHLPDQAAVPSVTPVGASMTPAPGDQTPSVPPHRQDGRNWSLPTEAATMSATPTFHGEQTPQVPPQTHGVQNWRTEAATMTTPMFNGEQTPQAGPTPTGAGDITPYNQKFATPSLPPATMGETPLPSGDTPRLPPDQFGTPVPFTKGGDETPVPTIPHAKIQTQQDQSATPPRSAASRSAKGPTDMTPVLGAGAVTPVLRQVGGVGDGSLPSTAKGQSEWVTKPGNVDL